MSASMSNHVLVRSAPPPSLRTWSALRYFLFLLWLSAALVTSLVIFTNGFLLRRQVLHEVSRTKAGQQPVFDKAIILIVDALRHDFAAWDHNASLAEDEEQFRNKLPIVKELQARGTGKLFEFVADPPTTTLQRLKGLTTGGLPTFIDVSSNFASSDIGEDNLMSQLASAGKRIAFMGDDTWTGLFPTEAGVFSEAYPYPSFDVWDLDTVDNGVNKHLFPLLQRPQDWDVLIGHYLGVDHAGHKFGPRHPEMARKLREADVSVRRVAEEMPEGCLLLVAGDHGMTPTGDHGGDSHEEVTAALFVHSKKFKFDSTDGEEPVAQVDFAPTMSLLLGVPIPYSNLGRIIPDLFAAAKGVTPGDIQAFLEANVRQVHNYLERYAQLGGSLPEELLASLRRDVASFRSSGGDPALGLSLLARARENCRGVWARFDEGAMWAGATFTTILLATAVALASLVPRSRLLTAVVSGRLLAYLAASVAVGAASGVALRPSSLSPAEAATHSALLATTLAFGFVLLWKLSLAAASFSLSAGGAMLARGWHSLDAKTGINAVLVAAAFACSFSNSFVVEEASVLNFLAVSFLVSYLWLLRRPQGGGTGDSQAPHHRLRTLSSGPSRSGRLLFGIIVACGVVRLSSIYFRCREEQAPYCVPTEFHRPLGTLPRTPEYSEYSNYRFGATFVSVVLLVLAPRYWLERCGNRNAVSPAVIAATYAPGFAAVCTVFYWALEAHDFGASLVGEEKKVSMMARAAMALQAFLFLCVLAAPNMVLVDSSGRRKGRGAASSTSGGGDTGQAKKNRTVGFGLGTALSAPLVCSVSCGLVPAATLLLGDGLAPAAVLMLTSMSLFTWVSTAARLERAAAEKSRGGGGLVDLLEVPWECVLGWWLLENFYFYSTGHQPTFPSIHWHSAFIGFSGSDYGSSSSGASILASVVLPAALIGFNTFCARVVFAFALPVLLLAPFCLWLTCPSARRHYFLGSPAQTATEVGTSNGGPRPEDDEEGVVKRENLEQGEVFLLERPEEAKAQLFKLCCKYICLQAFRALSSMLAAAVLRRHLMVWKIFAPRFVFEAVGFIVSVSCVLLAYLATVRVLSSLGGFYRRLEKEE